jgi:hypothetical protein
MDVDRTGRGGAVAILAAAAAGLLALAAATEVAAALGFALGRPVSPWALVAGAAGAAATTLLAARGAGRRAPLAASAIVVAAALAGPIAARRVYDVSWDGQTYHQLGVLRLAEGWNPVAGPLPVPPDSSAYFVNHYAKGAWLRAAVAYQATGDLEAAKGWTIVLLAAAGLAAAAALLAIPPLHAGWAAAGGALAAANPVLTAQLLTSYVDGQLGAVLTAWAALALLALLRGAGVAALAGLAACALLAPGLKFTGAVYAVPFGLLAALAASRWRPRAAPAIALACAAGVAAGVAGVGWNPYFTNWRTRGHPFYPLAGPEAIDIIPGQIDAGFLARSPLRRLAISTFAASYNQREGAPVLKWPFQVLDGETSPFRWPDVRFGGFGPLFSGGLLLAAAAAAAGLLARSRPAALAALAAAALLAAALLNPHAWWARYAPQLWLVPLALALAGALARRRAAAVLAAAALAVLAADAALVATNALRRAGKRSDVLRAQLASLAREPGPVAIRLGAFEAQRVRLRAAGVRFVEVERLPCLAPETIESSSIEVCRPGAR